VITINEHTGYFLVSNCLNKFLLWLDEMFLNLGCLFSTFFYIFIWNSNEKPAFRLRLILNCSLSKMGMDSKGELQIGHASIILFFSPKEHTHQKQRLHIKNSVAIPVSWFSRNPASGKGKATILSHLPDTVPTGWITCIIANDRGYKALEYFHTQLWCVFECTHHSCTIEIIFVIMGIVILPTMSALFESTLIDLIELVMVG
jgi:hypothetical protein